MKAGFARLPITPDKPMTLDDCIVNAEVLLENTAEMLCRVILASK